ncbi:hypothetical protein H4R35_005563 [Dimargaris xerosporica]|nr:hypothetical protein H4R35_005563 [Dimargaris xerosporica]
MVSAETWLIWQLVDSALPTGGFVASAGLETAFQLGLVTTSSDLDQFLRTSVHTYAYASLPFVDAAFRRTAQPPASPSDCAGKLLELDHHYHILNTNTAVRRASVAQGTSLLILYLKSFVPPGPSDHRHGVVQEIKRAVRLNQTYGHFPVCFGVVAQLLGLSQDNTRQLFIFMFIRQIVSAAVRLNIVGPYQAQRSLADALQASQNALERTQNLSVDQACQTAPVVDGLQAAHDRLYSRIFNS